MGRQALTPLFERQPDLPRLGEFLIGACRSWEGTYISTPTPSKDGSCTRAWALLWSARLTRVERGTITVPVNGYGFELLARRGCPIAEPVDVILESLLTPDALEQALNLSELCRRRFRSIAQITGLVQGR